MTSRERAAQFFAETPEFDGTLDEALEAHRQHEKASMREKWGLIVEDARFGCPFCGASSGEACIDENTSEDMATPHDERVRLAAVHDRSPTDQ